MIQQQAQQRRQSRNSRNQCSLRTCVVLVVVLCSSSFTTTTTTTTAFAPSFFQPQRSTTPAYVCRLGDKLALCSSSSSSFKDRDPKLVKTTGKKGGKTSSQSPTARRKIRNGGDDSNSSFSGPSANHHRSREVRPVLVDYAANRNRLVNQQRLEEDEIGCEHFEQCSGCVVGRNVGQVDIIRSAKLYFSSTAVRKHRMDVIKQGLSWSTEEKDDGFYQVIVPSSVNGWRTQAKLAVAPKSSGWAKEGCMFGLYKRGTHQVLSIPQCAVHHPSINRAVHALVTATAKVGIAAFQESTREGGLRYVQFQVERVTGKVCLTLIWHAETLKETQPALSRLVKELNSAEPDLWHSFWCHCNNGSGNNIFSRNPRRWHRISGPEFLREPIPTGEQGWLYFSPLTFRQGNLDGFDVLAADVARAVPGGTKVCELYAGVGVLGLTALAYHANDNEPGRKPLAWIRCSDENPSNLRCFQQALDSLPLHVIGRDLDRKNGEEKLVSLAEVAAMVESGKASRSIEQRKQEKAKYMVATAGNALKAGQALGAQVLIVDPPRKGLEEEVLAELCKKYNPDQPYVENAKVLTIADEKVNWANDIKTLIYVSCGFDALARDSEKLLSSQGGWVLESATGYVLFPGSDHVETLAIFQRR